MVPKEALLHIVPGSASRLQVIKWLINLEKGECVAPAFRIRCSEFSVTPMKHPGKNRFKQGLFMIDGEAMTEKAVNGRYLEEKMTVL